MSRRNLARSFARPLGAISVVVVIAVSAHAWNNGPSGNAATNLASECDDPPYATHDWIADHALDFLPDDEKAWLVPHRALYLIGTEAPDNDEISADCGAPHQGYDDRSRGHSVDWNDDHTEMFVTRAARRAQEEYSKAVIAFEENRPSDAAFYLGAMAHYIGDVSQYGHAYPDEENHSNYESWVRTRTDSPQEGVFEDDLVADGLVRRRPFTAVRMISRTTSGGSGVILPATTMDSLYSTRPPQFVASVAASLNLGVNTMADVLHTFYLNVVDED